MRRIGISVFAFCIAGLLLPQNVAAQAPGSVGDAVFRQEGIASWYGAQFEGRPTASGEIFDPSLFTAAHPTLPFGTFLVVTNRNNNRQVSVRVNDRGPFVEGRIIDVSQAAAEHLGMVVTGTAPVIIETIPHQANVQPQQPAVVVPPQVQVQQPQVVAQPQQVHVQQQPQVIVVQPQAQPQRQQAPVQQQAPAQQQTVVPAGTTTVPLDVSPNVPFTINIFHTPHDPSQPPVVEVVPTAPQATPRVVQVSPQPQPEPQVTVVETFWPARQAVAAHEEWQPTVYVATTQPATPVDPPMVIVVPQDEPAPWHAAIMPQHEVRSPPAIMADPNSTYRVQVGSFRVARNAVDTFVRLRAADFEPSYERSGEFFRVVLAGIRGTEVQSTLDRLVEMGYDGVMVLAE